MSASEQARPGEDDRRARRQWFAEICGGVHDRYASLTDGEPADYIPELAEVDPDLFAIAGVTVDDHHIELGDSEHRLHDLQKSFCCRPPSAAVWRPAHAETWPRARFARGCPGRSASRRGEQT